MLVFLMLLFIYIVLVITIKKECNKFLVFAFILIGIHTLTLYIQYGHATGGSDEDFYLENAIALQKGWPYFLSFREYMPSSYYAYSLFVHWVSIASVNDFLWMLLVRLSNALIIAIALLPYNSRDTSLSGESKRLPLFFLKASCLWLLLFNFRDSHILAIILVLFAANYLNEKSKLLKIMANIVFLPLMYFYKPELYAVIFALPVAHYIVKKIININYPALKLVFLMLVMFLPLAFIKLPPPLDYLALRMVYNSEVDVNEHTELSYDPIDAYSSGNTTIIGQTIVERVFKRLPIIFVGYNPLVMLFDYTKSFNEKFGLDLTFVSYLSSQLVFLLYYFVLNPLLILLTLTKRFENTYYTKLFLAVFITTIFYYSLYNVLQGSAQPRITIPLTTILVYMSYKSGYVTKNRTNISKVIFFILMPVMLLHYGLYAVNLIK